GSRVERHFSVALRRGPTTGVADIFTLASLTGTGAASMGGAAFASSGCTGASSGEIGSAGLIGPAWPPPPTVLLVEWKGISLSGGVGPQDCAEGSNFNVA